VLNPDMEALLRHLAVGQPDAAAEQTVEPSFLNIKSLLFCYNKK